MEKDCLKFDSTVRYMINKHIVENGFAPDIRTLADKLNCTEEEIKGSFTRLSEGHGLVLHPNGRKIWVAHPFSTVPTPFWVRTEKGSWWGNCAWCSLGIVAMLNEDASIFTRSGAEEEPIRLSVQNGQISDTDPVMHISVPTANWWDDVIYACATILLFKSEEEVDRWCKNHDITKGTVLPIEQAWRLAKVWYGDYLDPNWKRKTPEEVKRIFKDLGLTGSFWQLRNDWK